MDHFISGFLEGESRYQTTLFPEALDDQEDNPVRVIDVYVDDLDRCALGFNTEPADTGRPTSRCHVEAVYLRQLGLKSCHRQSPMFRL